MKRLVIMFLILSITTGCVEDKPRPEGNVEILPLQVVNHTAQAVEVINQQQKMNLTVKHHVRDQNVYVECYIPSFTFKEKGGKKVNGEGHIRVSVDGEKMNDINTAAFVVKGLDRGRHEILLEVVHNDLTTYNMKKSWNVTIN